MLTLYQLKPRFQALLRPGVAWLAAHGVTANAVTLAAMLLSLALGAGLCLAGPQSPQWFLLLPGWMLARMALNAVDGMLAREFGQQSALGAYLNELADVLADAALFAPFALQPALGWPAVCAVIVLSGVSEMAGALGPMVGAPRQYDGPLGKSDRALLFGALGLWLGLAGSLPAAAFWLMPVAILALVVNMINRIRSGLRAIQTP
ncbi:CDP-diacylglycerol--glycerol-3-phosphate 3-phosphatidyltransferase [Rivihabitans pingtungensis]|mgnify:FL=1|jgi:CDP-diacylglycerol--glycerol-3-phosphate 3-phosphatidyltransferase|uniref:CDP-diacylglycerol--glycerol-3-phosphate 3-phosphatidyltransferase n=1 Tax=Rivihabitans pingtungensis TaxID=1054498 RepID=A0A318KR96_9NEIS|nr:CDP-alcohol phosphatidyltransferase family protein [Rivihabitans pingtungensis]PXX80341.1 CDP-diacylglycerol--glycerol-3-phosphate 3-phosphatidyltransferase [Rivihabitans pingtungensis]